MADEIAKIEGNEVTAGFVSHISRDSGSNNNKLAVRPVEKVAKFPKKVALKSPKKTGVKKKNYYNTKLTFSKDPRNPNAIASTTATAIMGAEAKVTGTCTEDLETAASLTLDEIESGVGIGTESATGVSEEEGATEEGEVDEVSVSDDEAPVEAGDEMVDVDVLQVTERSGELSSVTDEAPTMMPVAVIAAVDMIKFSTLLMP
jgi:hypothetical protein